jgi:hypothetical protein
MNRRQHQALRADVQRLRPLVAVSLAILEVTPSFWETATGTLSVVTFLTRLVLALFVSGVLVWAASGVVLHYAAVQARSRAAARAQREMEQ